jgi:MscS family membrane protein
MMMLAVSLLPCSMASADDPHPLQPPDLSSPRATLNTFLATSERHYGVIAEEFWSSPSRGRIAELMRMTAEFERMFDLSTIPPAARFELCRDAQVYLFEVLSRIELPAESSIPDAQDAGAKGNGEADKSLSSWTIPHTEITLVRVDEGPQAGQYLFSAATAERAREFYERTSGLPYRRPIPIENYAEMRPYLSMTGWLISAETIHKFPNWLKYGIYRQAVWKWIALLILILVYGMLVMAVHRVARYRLTGVHSAIAELRRLVTPVALLALTPMLRDVANRQLTLTGWVSGGVSLAAETIYYFSLAWIAWKGAMIVAELIIASPRIAPESLDAHLLRLGAKAFGIVVAVAIVLYVGSQLGVPVYGLVTGLGVGGLAVALAAQPTIENFIASISLFVDRPVRVGDFCRYGDDAHPDRPRIGVVESIGLRSSTIRGIDDRITTIPNADFAKMHIVNYRLCRHYLLLTVLGLRYETTDDQLRFLLATLRQMLSDHPRVVDVDPQVSFAGFGDFSLNVEIRVHVNTVDWREFCEIREDILFRVMKIIKDAGSGFAFPSRTVYTTQDEGLDAERQRDAVTRMRAWSAAEQNALPHHSDDESDASPDSCDQLARTSSVDHEASPLE